MALEVYLRKYFFCVSQEVTIRDGLAELVLTVVKSSCEVCRTVFENSWK